MALKDDFEENGYVFPILVLSLQEAAELRARYMEYYEQNKERLGALPPKEHYQVLSETHTFLKWVWGIASHPKILDAVETLLGPNLLVWSSRWFSKMPGDKTYVSWHQDATYWGLHPLKIATAWIALSNSNAGNGGMRVIPGTHKLSLPQLETYAPDNALTRGQEIAVEVDESQAVDINLLPGEMSLHHVLIVHSSKPNTSARPRIGIAVRYVSPEVQQEGGERSVAILVRGQDDYGNFDLIQPPGDDTDQARQAEATRRMMKNIMK